MMLAATWTYVALAVVVALFQLELMGTGAEAPSRGLGSPSGTQEETIPCRPQR